MIAQICYILHYSTTTDILTKLILRTFKEYPQFKHFQDRRLFLRNIHALEMKPQKSFEDFHCDLWESYN